MTSTDGPMKILFSTLKEAVTAKVINLLKRTIPDAIRKKKDHIRVWFLQNQ
jgi:hypothetical protein